MDELPESFLEGIDEKTAKVSAGDLVETAYGQLERIELRNGYLAAIIDWQDIFIETRIPLSMLDAIMKKRTQH
jgi:hypothetical protein